MFEVFNKDNVKEVLNKTPLIVFYSENGACGPSGLLLVIYSDHSSYGYSTLYKSRDYQLIKSILEYVPQFSPLLQIEDEHIDKRKRKLDEMNIIYLGLGNFAFIHNSIFEEKLEMNYPCFKEVVKSLTNKDIGEIFMLVKEEINGRI